jgi:hypothetical protein
LYAQLRTKETLHKGVQFSSFDGEAEENNKKVVTSTRSAYTRDGEIFFLVEVDSSRAK